MIPLLVLAESMHWKVSLIQLQIENMMNWELDTYQLYIRNITNTFVRQVVVRSSPSGLFISRCLCYCLCWSYQVPSSLWSIVGAKIIQFPFLKAANQHPIRTMAPLHNNQATNCGKLWQELIVSSFSKLEYLTAMPVLNFAHPPHEKKDEACEGQNWK